MERRAELEQIIDDLEPAYQSLIKPYIDELSFIDNRIKKLRKLPFILINGRGDQRQTAASKQYKELSQTRDGIIRSMTHIMEKHSKTKKGEFTLWLESQQKNRQ